ncbi:LamG-like jellyroll fold domain-containing protein [Maribellus maritimus]|uniref:LamG-like jellyroll fold domain-containing protein n=1 Tax=Maribellus maritimus TaxID=2870838 RepID=UPI001EEB954D|nr:LamG-like jellyroll fold domain-containing protein [Maribellus maritimus]MCG6187591.1 T9SS type A sorting domain-containing protein [Maribellus maritimus]
MNVKTLFIYLLAILFANNLYAREVGVDTLQARPVVYWGFDEISGKTVNDQIGGLDGVWQDESGSPTWTTGKVGGACQFKGGVNDNFFVEGDPLAGCTEFTISAWFKMDELGGNMGLIATRNHNEGSSERRNWGFAAESDHVDARWDNNQLDSNTKLLTAQWYHVAITWENTGDKKLYMNGKLDNEGSSNVTEFLTHNFWWLGKEDYRDRVLKGYLDEVTMFKVALDSVDIEKLYAIGNEGKPWNALYDAGNATSVGDLQKKMDDLFVFPNPAQSVIKLKFENVPIKQAKARLYNQNGQLVREKIFNGNMENYNISVVDLVNGIYFISIVSEGETKQSKFIIHR